MSLDAMKQALEALEEVVYWYQCRDKNDKPMPIHNQNPEIKMSIEAITALRAAIEQAQEPVAWMTFDSAGEEDDIWYDNPDGKLLEGWTYKPLYTAPPRQWQGLTDDERKQFRRWAHPDMIEAIELRLQERNT